MDGLTSHPLAVLNMSDTSSGKPPVEGNIEEGALTKKSYFARVAALGKAEGLGDNSRPGLFMITCEAACRRVIEPTDAEDVFDRYSKQVAATQGVGWKPQASAKQQVSKLRTAIKLGLLTHVNGMDVCNKVVAAQRAQRGANEGKNDYPPFDGLVKVARFQLKDPDKILGDEVIGGLLIKPAGEMKDEADRLEKVVKQIESLIGAKEDPLSEESVDALTEAAGPIMTRIRELGGSTSMKRQEAKAREAAAAAQAQASQLVDLHRAAQTKLAPAVPMVAETPAE